MALPQSHPPKTVRFSCNITFSYLIDFHNRYLSCQRKIDSTGMLVNLNVKRDKSLTSGRFFFSQFNLFLGKNVRKGRDSLKLPPGPPPAESDIPSECSGALWAARKLVSAPLFPSTGRRLNMLIPLSSDRKK